MPSIAVATCLMAGALLMLAPTAAPAEGEEVVEAGDVVDFAGGSDKGMPATNPRVKALLAAHPSEFVTICVAGCAGKPAIVQALPQPVTGRAAEMRTTAARMGGSNAPMDLGATDANAVICVAGCGGPPGQVIQRMGSLPLPPKVAPRSESSRGNEPLDVDR